MAKRLDGPSDAAKLRILRRDRYKCAYCGIDGKDAELQIDHIVPVAKGGSHHIGNLITSCRSCNQSKGIKTNFTADSRAGDDRMDNGFNGLFLHTYKDGKIHNQAQIIGKDGDLYALQLFSFLDGRPTDVKLVDRDFLINQCKMYSTEEAWHAAYDKEKM